MNVKIAEFIFYAHEVMSAIVNYGVDESMSIFLRKVLL